MAFLDKFLLFFSGNDDPAIKKKKDLRQLGKEIGQNKYRKFYRVRSEELSPDAGSFFYDTYKTVVAAQNFMKNAEKSAILKQFIAEAFFSREIQGVYERLSPESIAERAKTLNQKELSQQLQQDIHLFSSILNNEKDAIDRCYKLILTFTEFVSFDFFSLLKKFDPRMKEMDFAYQPQFRYITGKYVSENLKDFLALASLEGSQEEWKTIFEILKKYKGGKHIIDLSQWKKLLPAIQDIYRSNILVMIIRYTDQNPKWQRKFNFSEESMAEAYIKAKKEEVDAYINKILKDKQTGKQDVLAQKLFGNKDIIRLQHYTHTANEAFTKKDIDGFTHITGLNYLKGFLDDYYDVRELCDLFLIRGQWKSQELSRQLSQGLHDVTDVVEELTAFEDSLGDTGLYGSKLKSFLNKSKIDKGQINSLKAVLSIVNNKAEEILDKGVDAFALVGTYLKDLSADYGKSQSNLLVNWKEIESVSERPITQRLEQNYKVIDNFVLLLQLFSPEEGKDYDLDK